MKKSVASVTAILLAVAFALLVVAVAALMLYNPVKLFGMKTRFAKAVGQSGIQVMETQAVYGKLNGNGNGSQFFVALLVEAGEAELEKLVEQLDEKYDTVGYARQTGTLVDVKYLEHDSVRYETKVVSDRYYTVYLYSDQGGNPLDIFGH